MRSYRPAPGQPTREGLPRLLPGQICRRHVTLPFVVIWILQSFIVQVPIQLEEAAKIDGANAFQVFFLAVPPIIFTFVASKQIITGMKAGAVKG